MHRFSVYSRRKGKPFKHEVKALEIIWAKFPDYSAANTLHIDDLSRNFALNPQCGLKIPAYKVSPLLLFLAAVLYANAPPRRTRGSVTTSLSGSPGTCSTSAGCSTSRTSTTPSTALLARHGCCQTALKILSSPGVSSDCYSESNVPLNTACGSARPWSAAPPRPRFATQLTTEDSHGLHRSGPGNE